MKNEKTEIVRERYCFQVSTVNVNIVRMLETKCVDENSEMWVKNRISVINITLCRIKIMVTNVRTSFVVYCK